MKQVFEISEVAHIWANQSQPSGRNSQGNFYFEGATIYSYGRHFPIATIEGRDVLITLDTYSKTTSKQISTVKQAITHLNKIYCFEVPEKYNNKEKLNKQSFTSLHEKNVAQWKRKIVLIFDELGDKRKRNKDERINEIKENVSQLLKYCTYFSYKFKDKELQSLIDLSFTNDFVEKATAAKEIKVQAAEKKMKQAAKAYEIYVELWRKYDSEGLQNLPAKTKELCNYYANNSEAFTRLRFNTNENRLETSKGVQIPAEVAKRAYIQLNGCMEGSCKEIAVPVLNYTITETTDKYIKAGCHTIPKEDVKYIVNLLNW